jgi:hypothetical protein
MNFEYWSFEKKKAFMNSLKFKSKDGIYKILRSENFEIYPQGNDLIAATPSGEYYYFQMGLRQRNPKEKELKKKYRHRYIIVRI